ncbi:MAG: hypothetical protein A2161_09110 [Candidatus Schekmanbacteria bacterium RBG_13_48_7]|uniref:Uncharacterized protein n=1 Tax=Candidatus Schekmanbacteria bacterium RBG_13_48_7 TaxID=1817878 RepID=A0A1F7S0S7_9BACT|nr:MAG: hypothetical protein A2161_09110 [Candidatus Schekmanbacteria bacterium RBG_13_48_7]
MNEKETFKKIFNVTEEQKKEIIYYILEEHKTLLELYMIKAKEIKMENEIGYFSFANTVNFFGFCESKPELASVFYGAIGEMYKIMKMENYKPIIKIDYITR